jgi:hypothetical protein
LHHVDVFRFLPVHYSGCTDDLGGHRYAEERSLARL